VLKIVALELLMVLDDPFTLLSSNLSVVTSNDKCKKLNSF